MPRNSPWTYGMGYFAIMLPSTMFSMFFSFYYIDGLGLALGLYGLARIIYVIWDAIVQPVAGFLSDRTRTRWGRRKPWLLSAIPFYALVFILFFSVPGGVEHHGLFFWFLTFQMSFETCMAILYVNFASVFPEVYKGEKERARTSTIQQGFYIVALLIGAAATPTLTGLIGYSWTAVVYGAIFVVCMLGCVLNIREDPMANVEQPLGLGKSFGATLGNKPFWLFSIANLFSASMVGIVSAAIPFYCKYVLGGANLSVLMAVTFVGVIPMALVWYMFIKRWGSLRTWKLSAAVSGLTVIPLFFAGDLLTGVAAGVVLAFGLAGIYVTPQLVLSRIIDTDAVKTGRRREGVYMAVNNFIVRASALLVSAGFLLVGLWFGYKDGDDPGSEPVTTFRVLAAAFPLVFMAISFLLSLLVRERDIPVVVPESPVVVPEEDRDPAGIAGPADGPSAAMPAGASRPGGSEDGR